MELNHLIILSATTIIVSFMVYILTSLQVILNKKTTPKKQRCLTNMLLIMGISGLICAIISHCNGSIDNVTYTIFLIVSSGVLTYSFMEKLYINRIAKEIESRVSEYDK